MQFNAGVETTIELRPIDMADWPRVHEWASTERACRYQAWGPNTPEETRQFVAASVAAWAADPCDRRVWMVQQSGVVVGMGELAVRNRQWAQGEIGYAVHGDHWGRGIATAIATELLRRAFTPPLGLHRVVGTCDPRNIASGRVLKRIGMSYEGRLRHTMRLRDGWRDSDIYSMLHHEWPPFSGDIDPEL